MIKRIVFSLFIFFIFFNCSFSQTISGVVVSDTIKISNARVILKKGTQILAFIFTDKEGKFIFNTIIQDSLEIQAAHLNYETHSVFLERPIAKMLKIELVEKTNFLEEVSIKKELPIRQKKDTVVYNLKHFRDGSEKVIEDLLKKLPGITVNDAGKISYNGKEIQALMIDGTDLFNSQYTIGSKNLDANAVETIEAIENFNKNKVLHQITETDKVAINLKLKKGQPVFTSRAELENDFYSKYDNSATTMLLHSKYMGFSVNRINNIGNSDGLDFSFIDPNATNKSRVREIISEGAFPQSLGEQNSLLNNTFSTNNALNLKLSKQASSTFGINYQKDRLWQDIENVTRYRFEDEEFVYKNTDNQVKKPEVISINNQIEYYNDKDLQLNTNFVFEKRQSNFVSKTNNNGVFRESRVNSKTLFAGGKTEVTKMLGENSALKFYAILSQNQSEQRFSLSPAIEIDDSILADQQTSDITTNYFEGQAQYYRNWQKVKLKITNTAERKTDIMLSQLKSEDATAEGFNNDVNFQSFINRFVTDVTFGFKKFRFGISQTLWYNQAKAEEKEIHDFRALFRTEAKYAITKKHSVQFVLFQQLETPSLENVFDAPVLTSYRSVSLNEGKIDNIKSTEASLNYIISDFYNTFYLKASMSYTHKDKDYYQTTELSPLLIYNKTILLNQGNNWASFNLSVHKLIPFLKINFKYNATYMFSSFYNFIDDSNLRSVRSQALNNEIILYKTLNKRWNLDNKINIDSNFFEADDDQQNTLTQIKNEFKVNYKVSKAFSIKSTLQTFIPDNQKNQNYNFLGFEASYNLERLNCEMYLRGQNLLNHKTFNSVLVSDYAVSSFSYRLQERNVLLGLLFKIF